MNIEEMIAGAGGAVTAGSVLIWVFKAWTKSVNRKLDEHSRILKEIEITLASKDGKSEGESALM